ncbi:MAG: T9SS type A sorting domain-containing protein [Chitinophagales bacterium]|nr:T9SS type A sorting domain-containing protein [Chitinophagales bacterium]
MKNVFYLLAIVLSASNLSAQISLEHSYPNGKWQTSLIKLSNSGMKYQWVDEAAGILKLYNLDHSIFKTMTFPVLSGVSTQVLYVSETTFDLDATIEFMVAYSDDNNWANSVTKIVEESGALIFDGPGETPSLNADATAYGAIFNTPSGTKMILDNHTDNASKVYSLPGTLVATAIQDVNYDNNNFLAPYPNPAGNYITLAYSLPSSIKEAKVSVYDMEGRIVKSYTIDHNYTEILIDTQGFGNGTYLCQINSNETRIADTKFIVLR